MAVLALNQPLTAREPVLVVENKLAPGQHRFSLVVIDDRGLESAPDVLVVTVRRPLLAARPRGRPAQEGRTA